MCFAGSCAGSDRLSRNIMAEFKIPTFRNRNQLKAVSYKPYAIMMEYLYFSFKPFGEDVRVSSLSDMLLHIDSEYGCEGFRELVACAAGEVVRGLAFLHGSGIAHRDLKPANVLVSNQHYSALTEDEIACQFQRRPVICKLTDFGESRSAYIQTQTVMASQTSRVDRGTVVYMAPEILVPEQTSFQASLHDLAIADIWSLGMTLFTMINPNIKCPYLIEIKSAKSNNLKAGDIKMFISDLQRSKKLPTQDSKYETDRATIWSSLEEAYIGCTSFDPTKRLSLEDIEKLLTEKRDIFQCSDVMKLKISQNTALEQTDYDVARKCSEGINQIWPRPVNAAPSNDGSNACAFLSVKIADRLIHEFDAKSSDVTILTEMVEETIWFLPERINDRRDLSKHYDVMEAYEILSNANVLNSKYEFTEELPFADGVYSFEARKKLHSKLCSLGQKDFTAIFSTNPFIIVIGCAGGKAFVIDTHPVTKENTGLLITGKDNTATTWKSICVWLWNRLVCVGVKREMGQSLAVVTPINNVAKRHAIESTSVSEDDSEMEEELLGDNVNDTPCRDNMYMDISDSDDSLESESINNKLTRQKEAIVKNAKSKTDLTKLEFTRDVWEKIDEHQQGQLTMAICGLSDEYELSEMVSYLEVPPDEWFEMSESQRKQYLQKFNQLTIEEAMAEKPINVRRTTSTSEPTMCRKTFSVCDLEKSLQSISGCTAGLVATIVKEAENLLNCKNAIQQMPSLGAGNQRKFLVAAKTCKKGMYECVVYNDHSSCTCPCFKFNSICKYSLCVSEYAGILKEHLKYLAKSSRPSKPTRSGLVEPPKNAQGKKGGTHKNQWRPSRGVATKNAQFTEIHHNNIPLMVAFIEDHKKAKDCRQCRVEFPRKTKIAPFDIVLSHKEKWMYPSPQNPEHKLPRGVPVNRAITLWQRASQKVNPVHVCRIKFIGEDGIDDGALAREFFAYTVPDIAKKFFPDGSPVYSTNDIASYRAIGEIVAASLAQGGPAPNFLAPCVYDTLASAEGLNYTSTTEDLQKHLTESELKLLEGIREDVAANTDTILEHSYTGPITEAHVESIVAAVTVSILSRRELMLKELKKGLELYDFATIITKHPQVCKNLFITDQQQPVDPDYLFSLLKPEYSDVGSTRRSIEESVMDNFQDLLFSLEDDSPVSAYREALAWKAVNADADHDGDDDDNDGDERIKHVKITCRLHIFKERYPPR
ncbi:hypothetical protein QZH41_005805 [Actinostola sp. cb2023]|nr:hypothetical protein QZH41_005805 [Actinostola sp. cb2023]